MRKILNLFLGIAFSLVVCDLAMAGSVGSGSTVGRGKFGMALEGDFVFDKDLKEESYSSVTKDGNGNVTDTSSTKDLQSIEYESEQFFVRGTYGILDRLDVFGKVGIAKAETDSNLISDSSVKYELDEDSDFTWGIGLKGIIHEFSNGVVLGGTAAFGMRENDVKAYTTSGGVRYGPEDWPIQDGWFTGATTATYTGEQETSEWQVALSVTKEFGKFLPYAGLRYSDIRIKETETTTGYNAGGTVVGSMEQEEKFEADDNVGVFVGTDFNITDSLVLNAEGRFIDETALSVGLTYRF